MMGEDLSCGSEALVYEHALQIPVILKRKAFSRVIMWNLGKGKWASLNSFISKMTNYIRENGFSKLSGMICERLAHFPIVWIWLKERKSHESCESFVKEREGLATDHTGSLTLKVLTLWAASAALVLSKGRFNSKSFHSGVLGLSSVPKLYNEQSPQHDKVCLFHFLHFTTGDDLWT